MKYRGFFPLLLTALLILSICVTGAAAIEKPLTQAQLFRVCAGRPAG